MKNIFIIIFISCFFFGCSDGREDRSYIGNYHPTIKITIYDTNNVVVPIDSMFINSLTLESNIPESYLSNSREKIHQNDSSYIINSDSIFNLQSRFNSNYPEGANQIASYLIKKNSETIINLKVIYYTIEVYTEIHKEKCGSYPIFDEFELLDSIDSSTVDGNHLTIYQK